MFPQKFYHCNCYYMHNIYIKSINKHFTYVNEEQFWRDYDQTLNKLGCRYADKKLLVQEILAEIDRRKLVQEKTLARKSLVKSMYIPLHADVYMLEEDFLDPSFKQLIGRSKNLNYTEVFKIVENLSTDKKLYQFPVFTPNFCERFLEEIKHFEQSNFPKEKPNSMNNYGILLDDIGFHDTFSLPIRMEYLDHLAKTLFPEWRGEGLDSHKIFTVAYESGKDTELGYHYDNSEITLNICLGESFEGSELYFGDMKHTPIFDSTCILVSHKIGYGILHRGQQYHGVLPVKSGKRQNLIIWMRSSSIRNSHCPMCLSKPTLIPSVDYGDGFTKPDEVMLCSII